MANEAKELTISLPESLVEDLGGVQKATEEVTQVAVLGLVRTGKISTGMGARLLHLTRHAFLDLMNAYDVPAIDYTPDSLAYELEGIRKLARKTAQS